MKKFIIHIRIIFLKIFLLNQLFRLKRKINKQELTGQFLLFKDKKFLKLINNINNSINKINELDKEKKFAILKP